MRPGHYVAETLLSPRFYPQQVSRVVILTRNPESDMAQALKAKGAEPIAAEPKAESFKGVEVFINTASSHNPEEWKTFDEYTKAAVDAGVKVFFPSDVGT